MARRNFSNIARPTSLSAPVGDSDAALPVVSTADYPSAPFTIALERGTVREELCLVVSKTSTSLSVERGYGGTVAQAHSLGIAVEHATTAEDYDEANAHITLTERDDHTQYLNASRHNALSHSTVLAAAAVAPVGAVIAWAGETAPTNWLLCDGSNVSRSTYSALFAVVGTNYGSGDGTSTFSLPDLRGRLPLGADPSNIRVPDVSARTRGGTGGLAKVTLTSAQMPSHTHTAQPHTHTGNTGFAGQHFHGNATVFGFLGAAVGGTVGYPGRWYVEERAGGGWDLSWGTTDNSTNHRHAFTTNNTTVALNSTGGGESHENLPPYQTMAYIIRALA
jgi:microcystin-dependent protein